MKTKTQGPGGRTAITPWIAVGFGKVAEEQGSAIAQAVNGHNQKQVEPDKKTKEDVVGSSSAMDKKEQVDPKDQNDKQDNGADDETKDDGK